MKLLPLAISGPVVDLARALTCSNPTCASNVNPMSVAIL